jgi:hypothetical protein
MVCHLKLLRIAIEMALDIFEYLWMLGVIVWV